VGKKREFGKTERKNKKLPLILRRTPCGLSKRKITKVGGGRAKGEGTRICPTKTEGGKAGKKRSFEVPPLTPHPKNPKRLNKG